MPKSVRSFILSWLIWEIIVSCAFVGMYLDARKTLGLSEVRSIVAGDSWLGFLVVLAIWPLCRLLRRLPATLVGLGVGLFVPLAPGWIWGQWIERYAWSESFSWSAMGLWIAGLEAAIPSALAGAIVGYIVAKKIERAPQGAGVA